MTKENQYFTKPTYAIMVAIGIAHLFNDAIQAVVPAMFPILEKSHGISYTKLGFIAFTLNMVSALLQPVVGYISDKKPRPFALPLAMVLSAIGMAGLAFASSYGLIIASVALLGLGSAVFHPEGSKVSFLSAGSKRGLAQSIYQVGGNTGQALAPLISAFVLVRLGQKGAAIFVLVAFAAVLLLTRVSFWYREQLEKERTSKRKKVLVSTLGHLTKKKIGIALGLLMVIIFARSFYVTSMSSFYVFHLMQNYDYTIEKGQLYIFLFLAFGAIGTFFGGPIADRIGTKNVIILSLLVPLPFALGLPFISATWIGVFLAIIGFFIMLSFSVTVVYAQELIPSKIGTMAGLTVGLAFGMGAVGAVFIGNLMDRIGVMDTMIVASYLPFLGLVGLLLPKDGQPEQTSL